MKVLPPQITLIRKICASTIDNCFETICSFSTRDTLQDAARIQFENNKKQRRNIFAQAAARGHEWGGTPPVSIPPPVPAKDRSILPRLRSGSGTSRTTATSDSGEFDGSGQGRSLTVSSSPSQCSTGSNSFFQNHQPSGFHTPHTTSTSSALIFSAPSTTPKGSSLNPNPVSALSPIASRMRERDADAMEKYLRRNRSGSQGTTSTDTKSQNESNYASAGPSANGDDITALGSHMSGSVTPRRLRPSMSAAQLRSTHESSNGTNHHENRNRSGTSPTTSRPAFSPLPLLTRSSSTSNSLRSIISVDRESFEESESYIGPPSQYAQFPEPPMAIEGTPVAVPGRRKGFHILAKPLQSFDSSNSSHRRGMSATSVRGS
jgi:hypothetical protein